MDSAVGIVQLRCFRLECKFSRSLSRYIGFLTKSSACLTQFTNRLIKLLDFRNKGIAVGVVQLRCAAD